MNTSRFSISSIPCYLSILLCLFGVYVFVSLFIRIEGDNGSVLDFMLIEGFPLIFLNISNHRSKHIRLVP